MGAFSQNGYTANNVSDTKSYKIPGTDRAIRLRKGPAGELLVLFAAWFHREIEPIDSGQLDDWGFAVRPIRGQEVQYDSKGNAINLSNHSSGCAEDLNATRHPLGKRGTFTPAKAKKIRDELGRPEYGGCVRWGGDYQKRADEMHFEIVRNETACAAALKKLTTPLEEPDMPLTDTDLDNVEARAMKANKAYGILFWVTPGGTGKALIDLVKDMKLQLDRIEDDTDQMQASRSLVAALDSSFEAMKSDAIGQDATP